MGYRYEFDDTYAGDLTLRRANYEMLLDGYRQLRDALEEWNQRALGNGAAKRPYEKEVGDLDIMIAWGDEQLAHDEAWEIVVKGISVGSMRYAKAALLLLIHRRQQDRADKSKQGWPDAPLRSLDAAIDRIGKIAGIFNQEPCAVLWEVIPGANELTAPVSTPSTVDGISS